MIRLGAVSLVLCLMVASILPAQAAVTRMPYGSFLTRPVSDANDFARLLRQDKVVAQRFADHYGINNDAIADYIEKYGTVETVSKSASYVEYFIDKNGKMRKHHKVLRPGTRILVVKGTPILDLRCGNPMNKSLPRIVEKVEPVVQEITPPPVKQPEVVAVPRIEIVEKPEAPLLPPPPPAEIPAQQPPVEAVAPSVTELGWLLPSLVGLGLVKGAPDGPPPPPRIPEASALVLGIGGTGFVLAYYRRRRGR